jgi:alkylation response protein AidB-like acyl-CoA dehydrogenase
MARCYALGEGLRLNVVEQLSMRVSGRIPGPEGSVSKILWAEAEQALQHLGMKVAGAAAVTGDAPERLFAYFRSRPVSVYGGSMQIQRNILSRYMLGLPR